MTGQTGTTTRTTRVSTMAAAANTKTMSITVTIRMSGCSRNMSTLMIAVVETLCKVTQ